MNWKGSAKQVSESSLQSRFCTLRLSSFLAHWNDALWGRRFADGDDEMKYGEREELRRFSKEFYAPTYIIW